MLGAILAIAALVFAPAKAAAWDLFRSENADVREGNSRMEAGQPQAALEAYERAARALPGEPAVHLDRGIALLEAGRLDEAREALRIATEPPAPSPIRAAAHYDLGLVFYRQAEAAAAAGDHAQAQRLFREAADQFRSSLRQQPGNRDAGWNLELALRRIQQEQQEQERRHSEQQDSRNPPEQQDSQQQDGRQDSQQQDGRQDSQSPDRPSESRQPDAQPENDRGRDAQQSHDPEQPGESGSEQRSDERDEQRGQGSRDAEQEGNQSGADTGGADPADGTSNGAQGRTLPLEAERVLDALADGEESLQRQLARIRGERQHRRVLKDW
jgi:Ca-activated chloride channel family protein